MADWTDRISSVVFTRIKNEFSSSLKTKYKMTSSNFSTVGSSDTPAVFPFVYVQLLPSAETGQDLEGTSINATLSSFQIEVTDNGENDSVANEIAWFICGVMKSMRYQMVGEPITEETDSTFRVIARYQRIVGFNDIL